jgi:cytochrome c
MPNFRSEAAVAAALLAAIGAAAAATADVEHGKQVFQACTACHSERPDAIGPSLRGVYGRRSATLEDFRYSNPMRRANLVWDEANLREYIKEPQAKVKGNRMPYAGLNDPTDLDDLIAYLETYK